MKTRIEKALKEAMVKTFEDICFMYPVPELEEMQEKLAVEAATEVKYRGDFTGKLLIEARGGLFSAIAVNILGDAVPSLQQKNDALGEIANIICGNVMPALGYSGEGYRIENPRSLSANELNDDTLGQPLAQIVLNLNQGRADIKFFVDGYYPSKERID